MPAVRSDAARPAKSPPSAARPLWATAVWTGLGPVVAGAVIAIAAVAICWLPASGSGGNAGSVLSAGVLTFLAALHGGITVDGVPADFVPLGLTVLLGLLAWRAGAALADAAAERAEQAARPLIAAATTQLGVFAATCTLAAALSPLGTSNVSPFAAALAALLLFAVTGTTAFLRASGLAGGPVARWGLLARLVPAVPAVRAAGAAAAVYVGAGALLVAASLAVHHDRIELLSRQVGGGWSGAPVLLLGALAAPNAAIAGASYLAGPGFAVGQGSPVSLGSTVHGTFPAFPLLGAVPSGPAGSAAWLLAAATPVAAGLAVVRLVHSPAGWRSSWAQLAAALAGTAVLGLILGWLGGGEIGSGRLSAVGASPWQFALAMAGGVAVVAAVSLAALATLAWWRRRDTVAGPVVRPRLTAVGGRGTGTRKDDGGEADQLAG